MELPIIIVKENMHAIMINPRCINSNLVEYFPLFSFESRNFESRFFFIMIDKVNSLVNEIDVKIADSIVAHILIDNRRYTYQLTM